MEGTGERRTSSKEKRKAVNKAYYKAHREERKAYNKSHREDQNAYMKAYSKAHRKSSRNWILTLLGGRCTSCGHSVISRLHVEHRNGGGGKEVRDSKNTNVGIRYARLLKSGKITEAQIHERLTLACRWCNYIKGTRTEEEWKQLVHRGAVSDYATQLLLNCSKTSTNGRNPLCETTILPTRSKTH